MNLRSTLDDLDPFVEASKPVAKKLLPYLNELRPFARDARPVVRDLNQLVRARGKSNDLVELNRTYPGLADIALDYGHAKFGTGRWSAAAPSPRWWRRSRSAPIVAHGRPYTPDFFGWFDDFSQTGAYDALGSFSRAQTYFNAFSLSNNVPTPIPLTEQPDAFKRLAKIGQYKRCPGGRETAADGSNVLSEEQQKELDCRGRATGPKAAMSEARALDPRGHRRAGRRRVLTGASDDEGSKGTATYVVFDNAFGLVEGGDVKIGASRPGSDHRLRPHRGRAGEGGRGRSPRRASKRCARTRAATFASSR